MKKISVNFPMPYTSQTGGGFFPYAISEAAAENTILIIQNSTIPEAPPMPESILPQPRSRFSTISNF
ncbi:MAG: hypothetical protein L6W00_16790 [Lentisphaeria bacterium]|nr:MAG: hypothetical protein L6W00_16790 [Lentisphaeria bacterium]